MNLAAPTLSLPLATKRLLIRDYAIEDAAAIYAYVREPAYWQHQRPEPPTQQQVEGLLQWVVKEQSATPRLMYFLAATRKDTGDVIGEGVLKIVNPVERQGEIGFGVSPRAWKQGYGMEIASAILDAAFQTFKLHRVSAQCSPDNKASVRILQKLGMGREGLLRDLHFARGKWWSTLVYSVLEDEYAKISRVKKA
jgi:ribosomal-protein-alanine N-acetyltransferase